LREKKIECQKFFLKLNVGMGISKKEIIKKIIDVPGIFLARGKFVPGKL